MGTQFDPLNAALTGRYRIERELGRGGMATVYLAEDLKHHRRVAIKVLKPELATVLGPDRFLREIEIAAQLTHPHILTLIDSGDADGFLYYVMPYLEGESLRERLKREKQLPLEDSLQIGRAVADALSYAHSLGIVHRDIKPENIMFEAGHPVVMDFGIARAITEAGGEHLTETGIAVGTPAYMSPEQAAGAREVDARSDIYALGCVLYEILAAEPPFTGPSAQAVLARHSLDPVPRLRTVRETVPEALEAVLLRALAKVPADRFATAREFAQALEESPHGTEVAGPVRSVWRRRAIPLVATASIVVVGVAGWWALARPGADGGRIESLAVLPLKNLMADSEQGYFVDGMHEALITELSKIGALKVISRTSTMRYRETDTPLPQIARELNVDGVIEGSVLREGERVRITVQLIDGRTDRHLWAVSFDRELRGILALHGEVARAIARQMQVTLTPQQRTLLSSARAVNPDAYELYLKGLYALSRSPPQLDTALRSFHHAVDLEPTWAPPYVGLGDSYARLAISGRRPPREVFPLARAALARALELDEALADAYAILGVVKLRFDRDWLGAERELNRALQLEPNSPRAHLAYGTYLRAKGDLAGFLAHRTTVRELDPLSPFANIGLATALYENKRYDEAITQVHTTLQVDPDAALAYLILALSYAAKRMHGEAIAACEKALGLMPEDVTVLASCARVNGSSATQQDAVSAFERLVSSSAQTYVDPYLLASLAATIYTHLPPSTPALEWLARAYEERSANLCFLNVDPAFDGVRSDPRFQELVRRMNFPG